MISSPTLKKKKKPRSYLVIKDLNPHLAFEKHELYLMKPARVCVKLRRDTIYIYRIYIYIYIYIYTK